MSGFEVIGGISAVITIISASVKIWDNAQKDIKLPETFNIVARRLPLLLSTLQTCYDQLNAVKETLPPDVVKSFQDVVQNSKAQARLLRDIFEETIPGNNAKRVERYKAAIKSVGKGKRVEELLQSISEDTCVLAGYRSVQADRPDLKADMEKLIEELKNAEPSVDEEARASSAFQNYNYGGHQNINTGDARHSGPGDQHVYGGVGAINQYSMITSREDFSFRQHVGVCLGQAPHIEPQLFVGRTAEMQRMRDILTHGKAAQEQQRLVLGGVGGIGKTQLAIAFATRNQDQYTSVLWLNAESEAKLQVSFQTVAKMIFEVQEPHLLDGKQSIVRMHRWLSDQRNTKWLLILDNYDDPDQFDITTYYPPASHGTILITTRRPGRVAGTVMPIQPLLDVEDSLEVLRTRSYRDSARDDPHARQLAERLGGLPLALATVGAYLQRSPLTFERYLWEYNRRWNLDPRRPTQLPEYQGRTLYTTWHLSYNRLEEDDPDAAKLLRLLAYFDHQSIWYALLQAGADESSTPWLHNVTGDEIVFNGVMTTLTEYCFVEVQTAAQSWSMHACVHDWTLAVLNRDIHALNYWYAFDSVTILIDRIEWDSLGSLLDAELASHGAWLVTDRFYEDSEIGEMPSNRCKRAHVAAELLKRRTQLGAGERMYLRALHGYEKAWGPEHTSTLDTVNNLGVLYADQGRMQEAERMYLRALRGYEKAWGPEHPSTLSTVNNLGALYADQGRMQEAERMYLRALHGKEKAWGPEHTSTLDTVNNLGVLYKHQGRMQEAERMYLRALHGKEKAWGPEHPSTLDTVNNLGNLYADQGRMQEAERMYLRALHGKEKAWGPEHTSTLSTVNNLGVLYAHQGRMQEAERMYLRALRGYEKAWGPEHTSTLDTVNNLGVLYADQGRMQEAEQMFQKTRP